MSSNPNANDAHSVAQTHREMELISSLGSRLLFRSFAAHERLGAMYEYRVEALSRDFDIDLRSVLGQSFTVRLDRADGEPRYFNGYVTEFAQTGEHGNFVVYEATLRPWVWFLTRTSDCRIFQNCSVPDIIKQIFREHGYPLFSEALFENYRAWEYCVQYRETDLDFVTRLMEQEGIYFYFTHGLDTHEMVLCDSPSSHDAIPGHESVPYLPSGGYQRLEHEHIFDWQVSNEMQPDRVSINDFDFKRPRAALETRANTERPQIRPAS